MQMEKGFPPFSTLQGQAQEGRGRGVRARVRGRGSDKEGGRGMQKKKGGGGGGQGEDEKDRTWSKQCKGKTRESLRGCSCLICPLPYQALPTASLDSPRAPPFRGRASLTSSPTWWDATQA